MTKNEKSITLTPDWKAWFWHYMAGVLLIPLAGLGLILLWIAHKNRKPYRYEIFDRYIKTESKNFSQKIDLADINEVEVQQRWIDQKFDIGSIRISSDESSMKLLGIENPERIADMIRHASQAEQQRIEQLQKKEKEKEPRHNPGTLDKLDYLTGLWQQGMISDEEYQKEKKHFE